MNNKPLNYENLREFAHGFKEKIKLMLDEFVSKDYLKENSLISKNNIIESNTNINYSEDNCTTYYRRLVISFSYIEHTKFILPVNDRIWRLANFKLYKKGDVLTEIKDLELVYNGKSIEIYGNSTYNDQTMILVVELL